MFGVLKHGRQRIKPPRTAVCSTVFELEFSAHSLRLSRGEVSRVLWNSRSKAHRRIKPGRRSHSQNEINSIHRRCCTECTHTNSGGLISRLRHLQRVVTKLQQQHSPALDLHDCTGSFQAVLNTRLTSTENPQWSKTLLQHPYLPPAPPCCSTRSRGP